MNVSLIIPSRGRPDHLALLLSALRFQRGVDFEVIVVSDLSEQTVRAIAPDGCQLKVVLCEDANLAKARNLGISSSQGKIIAFCDDDAIPEPNWLARLTAPFENPEVTAAAGFVRGRNGVSYQWKAMEVDPYGNDHSLDIEHQTLRTGPVKTIGTNSAFRLSALLEIGGFDEAFRFFLEDADVNLRLAKRGGLTAIVPRSEVHHAFAPSAFRYINRVPKSLFEIGASKAHFCKMHGEISKTKTELHEFAQAQKQRLIRFHDLGLLTGSKMKALIASLEDGFEDGAKRQSHTPLTQSGQDFLPFQENPTTEEPVILKAGFFGARAKYQEAEQLAAQGREVALIQFIYSPRYLTVRFTEQGYWLHRGGVFGKALRHEPAFRLSTRPKRHALEAERLFQIRTNSTNSTN